MSLNFLIIRLFCFSVFNITTMLIHVCFEWLPGLANSLFLTSDTFNLIIIFLVLQVIFKVLSIVVCSLTHRGFEFSRSIYHLFFTCFYTFFHFTMSSSWFFLIRTLWELIRCFLDIILGFFNCSQIGNRLRAYFPS